MYCGCRQAGLLPGHREAHWGLVQASGRGAGGYERKGSAGKAAGSLEVPERRKKKEDLSELARAAAVSASICLIRW